MNRNSSLRLATRYDVNDSVYAMDFRNMNRMNESSFLVDSTASSTSSRQKNSVAMKKDSTLDANSCLLYYKPELKMIADDQKSKREQEKLNVRKEIVASERKYLSDLSEIVEGYYEEISKLNPNNKEFVSHIFSNIKEIYEFTKNFYTMLELNSSDDVGIANCFVKTHKTFLKLYSAYCQNYKIAYCTTERLEHDRTLAKAIQKVKTKYGHCLRVATYLQLPVLRITKYHLLLHRFLRACEKDANAHKKIQEALDLMKCVNDQINKDMPIFSPNEKLSEGSSLTEELDQSHVESLGYVLKEDDLILSETRKSHRVILRQNMLIILKASPCKKVMHTIASEYLGFSPKISKLGHQPKNYLKMFTIIDYSQAAGSSERMCQFTFKAKSLDEKQAWQSAILSCMLNGYGKKLSDHVKNKFMVLNSDSFGTSSSIENKSHNLSAMLSMSTPNAASNGLGHKMKLMSNFKRLADIRSSLKTEFKKLTHFDRFASSSSSSSTNAVSSHNRSLISQNTSTPEYVEETRSSVQLLKHSFVPPPILENVVTSSLINDMYCSNKPMTKVKSKSNSRAQMLRDSGLSSTSSNNNDDETTSLDEIEKQRRHLVLMEYDRICRSLANDEKSIELALNNSSLANRLEYEEEQEQDEKEALATLSIDSFERATSLSAKLSDSDSRLLSFFDTIYQCQSPEPLDQYQDLPHPNEFYHLQQQQQQQQRRQQHKPQKHSKSQQQQKQHHVYENDVHSLSSPSLNSEEGYYSIHESSSFVEAIDNAENGKRTKSTPNLLAKLAMSLADSQGSTSTSAHDGSGIMQRSFTTFMEDAASSSTSSSSSNDDQLFEMHSYLCPDDLIAKSTGIGEQASSCSNVKANVRDLINRFENRRRV